MGVFDQLQERGLIAQTTNEEKIKELLNNDKVTFYIGFDPTADSLHVGHFVQIMVMSHLQKAGHTPIALFGGGTGMVGDPSGKTEMRKMLTKEEIAHNISCFQKQMSRLIDFSDGKAIMANNADWLLDLNYIQFLREVGVHFSVNRMLSFECYKQRLERGLSFFELNYMLMQSYDFLELNRRYNCVMQLGGDDQWSNIIGGVELVRRSDQKEVYGMTFTLLTTSEGKKMGKTEKGAVWLNPEKTSPFDFYQYWRNVDDADVIKCLKILTFLPMEQINEYAKKEGSELNAREAYQMISGAIDNEAADVDLGSNPKAYKKADVTKESSELQNMVNMYNSLAKANITYTFGDETVTLDGNTIKNWLQFDEKGQLLQNDEAFRQHVVDYVAQLAADHDTVGTERQFQTTSGRTVYVYGSAYGWKIDQDKEVAQLMQEIQSGTQTTREPVYSMRANAHGINDLGDTYIEVDLTEQYMWYYQNGNIIFQSEIVSGLPSDPDRKTPPGIFTLNSKSSPSVLRGEMTANGTYSYEQPVTYWMPFNGGIGFHDADWQPYFGGDRYLTGGSHGCINLPPENAGQLYSLIQYDVPIICFY